MRYVLGFLCGCALGVMPVVGCGEEGDANCGVYCDKSVECYATDRGACMESCADESANEAAISQECASAGSAQRACVGALSCDEAAAWVNRTPPDSFPCHTEFFAVEALCR